MKEQIAEFIREKAYKPMTVEELVAALSIPDKQQTQLQKTLQQMEATGEIIRTRFNRYGAPERMNLAVGRLQSHPKGFGFLIPDMYYGDDIFIGRESMGGAWNGDRVVVRLHPATRVGGRMEGEVIRILQRANNRLVGTFEATRHTGYVTPDERRIPDDIFIPKGATNGAKSGEKVVVQIVEFPAARRAAEGRVVERLGMKGNAGVDIISVIRKFGLSEAFPQRALKESEEIPLEVLPESIGEEGRQDLRGWTIVTIDGDDAKDLDDAVSIERMDHDRWRLGVHIADVAYYVKEGSGLDLEAYRRGTSVYLVDRVVPMLPPRLSNGICSLNTGVDRLTLSCVMEIDQEGRVHRYDIFPSVIRTAARLTYSEVNKMLAGEDLAVTMHEPLIPFLREMHDLMVVLRNKRIRRGALDFDLPESRVRLNAQGWPVEVKRADRAVAERIIEEFMLAANETVAEHCFRKAVPFMYRVHGEPSVDRMAALNEFLALFGYNLRAPRDGAIHPKLLQGVIDWSRGLPEEYLIHSVLLRSMRPAVYSEQNVGHFGLAADFYCHFTSPIRRYPDLIVHRILRAMLKGNTSSKALNKYQRWVAEAARHLSDRERVAMEAERETVDLKKAEYMSEKVGQVFDGMISGVSPFGFFVQLPDTIEGLVHVSSLTDDYYHFHEKLYALVGARTRRRLRLGDLVTVRLTRVDIENRQIEFAVEAHQTSIEEPAEIAAASSDRVGRKHKRHKARRETAAAAPQPETSHTDIERAPQRTRTPAAQRAGAPNQRRSQVDMWGIPLPDGRPVRSYADEDTGVINPFSIALPPKWERSRSEEVQEPGRKKRTSQAGRRRKKEQAPE